ncbi:MAG: Flg new 2 protein [Thermoproteota archaeon]|nr:Flg new 2 protein [Thermoproteota archaeon]
MLFRSRLQESLMKKSLAMILLICLAISVLPLSTALAASWNPGGPAHPYLTPKWTASVSGGGEALLTADVRSDYAGEEVFHAGGPVQPSSTAGSVRCFSGQTGNQIWRTNIYGIGDTATMQMADVDRDGRLEILVALQHPAGLYILNAEDGSILWNAPGTYNGHPGYFTPIGGRIDGSGVVGDTDGDGYHDIFIGVMAYEKQPTTGKIIHYEWSGSTIVERGRVQVWHPCAGGLSLGDTDNDGVFELYMNERDVYFGDGSWGRGLTSFWANNLTLRWRIYDWGASSDIPMLADVNKDGIVDVVSTNLRSGIVVLNSTDGHPLKNALGTESRSTTLPIHAHYQASIFDIDRDGNLELLCADGKESESFGTQVFDLWSWKLDANISAGYSFRGPSIGEVTGDGQMDIIVVTFDLLSNTNTGTVQIYNRNYQLMDSYGGLRHRAIGSVVQDVDRNDNGLNELLVLTQGGIIYCFDTPGLSQERLGLPRARSEVHFYSESRLGASEYVPYERPWPDVISPSPAPNALNVSTSTSQLSFRLNHPLGQTMSYSVITSPNVGSGSGTNVGNGLRTVSISGLTASRVYRWHVSVTDQSGHTTSKDFWFTTRPVYTNTAPSQGTPRLSSTNGGNTNVEDLTCYNQTTADRNGNRVNNIYNWVKNGVSIANLNLPFDSKPNIEALYSGTAVTRDYSGRGNSGTVFGATWIPNGVVGGAFSFDGNDFIRVEEQGNSLGGSGTWSQMSLEFWIKIPTSGSSTTVIWKADRYDTRNSNSYKITALHNANPELLQFTWYIYNATGVSSVSYNLTSGTADWHQVVCTYRSGVGLKIYTDGALRATARGSGNINATSGPLQIAFNRGGGRDFIGSLDEVRIYSYEVSSSFVNQRHLDTRSGSSKSEIIPRNDLVVGDQWTCQVTPNDGLADGTTRSSNTIRIVSSSTQHIFTNGFESGNFNAWTGTTTTTGGSATVVTSPHYSGTYSGQFSVNTGSGTRRAYCYENLGGLTQLTASAYVYLASGLPSSGQSTWLIQFVDSSGNALASYGIRADALGSHWAVQNGNTPFAMAASSVSAPVTGQWYLLQAYYTHSATGKTIVLTVNSQEVASLTQNTVNANNVANARFGIGYYIGSPAARVNIDDVTIDG